MSEHRPFHCGWQCTACGQGSGPGSGPWDESTAYAALQEHLAGCAEANRPSYDTLRTLVREAVDVAELVGCVGSADSWRKAAKFIARAKKALGSP